MSSNQGPHSPPSGLTLANWDLGGEPSLWAYRNAGGLFPHIEIPRGRPAAELGHDDRAEIGRVLVDASPATMPLDDYVASAPVDAVAVVHRGRIVYERSPRMHPTDRHLLMSVAKVFASTLVGLLEGNGLVDAAQPMDAIIPELAGSGWAGVRLIDVLDMASGIDCLEIDDPAAYTDPGSKFFQFEATLGWRPAARSSLPSTYDYVAGLSSRRPPGEVYEYTSVNTFVLSWILERVFGLAYHDVIASQLWSQVGSRHQRSYASPRTGRR